MLFVWFFSAVSVEAMGAFVALCLRSLNKKPIRRSANRSGPVVLEGEGEEDKNVSELGVCRATRVVRSSR